MAEAQTGLMAGEDVLTPHADDAQHWVDVYEELVGLVTSVLRQAGPEPGAPASGLHASELEFIQARVDALNARLEFWRRRLADLDWDLTGRAEPAAS